MLTCYTEDHEFEGDVGAMTTSGHYRSDYARCGLYGNPYAITPIFPFGESTTVKAAFRLRVGDSNLAASSMIASLRSADGLYGVGLYMSSGSTYPAITLRKIINGTPTTLVSGSYYQVSGTIPQVSIEIIDAGTDCTINVYFDDVLALTWSGDTSTFMGPSGYGKFQIGGTGATFYVGRFSEIIVSNGDEVRGRSVMSYSIDTAGDSNSWDGPYTNIDEVSIDGSVISTNTDGAQAQFSVAPKSALSVNADVMKISALVSKTSDAAVDEISLGVKTNSTVVPGTAQAISDGTSIVEALLTANPVTSSSWTNAELAALQLNVKATASV